MNLNSKNTVKTGNYVLTKTTIKKNVCMYDELGYKQNILKTKSFRVDKDDIKKKRFKHSFSYLIFI